MLMKLGLYKLKLRRQRCGQKRNPIQTVDINAWYPPFEDNINLIQTVESNA